MVLASTLAAGEALPLFVIERSLNRNVLHYEANLDAQGRLDAKRPVSAYWVMVEKGGVREELTLLEKAKAYGFSTAPIDGGRSYDLRLKAIETRRVRVKQEGGAVWAETSIGKRLCTLERIYIAGEGTSLIPRVLSIDLYGTDRQTGEPCRETIPGE
jgi:hypothetical protein